MSGLGSIESNIGALIIRIGFWGPFLRSPQNSVGNYYGPCIRVASATVKSKTLENSEIIALWSTGTSSDWSFMACRTCQGVGSRV